MPGNDARAFLCNDTDLYGVDYIGFCAFPNLCEAPADAMGEMLRTCLSYILNDSQKE
jgi:hypothetical protein